MSCENPEKSKNSKKKKLNTLLNINDRSLKIQ